MVNENTGIATKPEELPELYDYSAATRKRWEEGTVLALHGDLAEVLLRKGNSRGLRSKCCYVPDDDTMLVEAHNGIGAEKGDCVIVDIPMSTSVRAAYVLYGIPLLAFLLGLVVGTTLGSILFGGGVGVPLGLVFGFSFLAISYILLSRLYATGSRVSSRYRPVITRILQRASA